MPVVGAIIVPHPPAILPEIGRGRERNMRKTVEAYRQAARRVAAWHPETLVIASPHAVSYADYFHISPGEMARGSFESFGVPQTELVVKYDGTFAEGLTQAAQEEGLPAGTQGERKTALDHGVLVPLRFLREAGVDCPVVRLSLSGLPAMEHYRLGKCVAETARRLNRRVVFVASGDLSHRLTSGSPGGYDPQGPAFDAVVTGAMGTVDFLRFLTVGDASCKQTEECGLRAFQMMAGVLDGMAVAGELLSQEETFGSGYGVAVFTPEGPDEARHFDRLYEEERRAALAARRMEEDPWVGLARAALETYVRTGRPLSAGEALPWTGQTPELSQRRAGVFISLYRDGRLRGCVGTIQPATDAVGEEIRYNAVTAGASDPRFEPVRPEELGLLTYCVDVLEPPEPVDGPEDLDVGQYGVIVSGGGRRGVLLPNQAGVDTPRQQIEIARQKAGIWAQEPCRLERFRVTRHGGDRT